MKVSLSDKHVKDLWKLTTIGREGISHNEYEEAYKDLAYKLRSLGCLPGLTYRDIYAPALNYEIELDDEIWERIYFLYFRGHNSVKGTWDDRKHFEVTRYTIENQINDAKS